MKKYRRLRAAVFERKGSEDKDDEQFFNGPQPEKVF